MRDRCRKRDKSKMIGRNQNESKSESSKSRYGKQPAAKIKKTNRNEINAKVIK